MFCRLLVLALLALSGPIWAKKVPPVIARVETGYLSSDRATLVVEQKVGDYGSAFHFLRTATGVYLGRVLTIPYLVGSGLSGDGATLAIHDRKEVRIYAVPSGKLRANYPIPVPATAAQDFVLSQDGRRYALLFQDRGELRWIIADSLTGKVIRAGAGTSRLSQPVVLNHDGTVFAYTQGDKAFLLKVEGKQKALLELDDVQGITAAAAGKLLVAESWEQGITLYDFADGRRRSGPHRHKTQERCWYRGSNPSHSKFLAVTMDSKRGMRSTLWSTALNRPGLSQEGVGHLSSDGKVLGALSEDEERKVSTLSLYSTETGARLGQKSFKGMMGDLAMDLVGQHGMFWYYTWDDATMTHTLAPFSLDL